MKLKKYKCVICKEKKTQRVKWYIPVCKKCYKELEHEMD